MSLGATRVGSHCGSHDVVRLLPKLLAEASCLYPELAAQSGALNLAAISSLEQLDQED